MEGNPPIIKAIPPMTMITPASKKVRLLIAINSTIGFQNPRIRNITRLMTRIIPRAIAAHTIVEIAFDLSNTVHCRGNDNRVFLTVPKASTQRPIISKHI